MRDGIRQEDAFAIQLQCGHPNIKPNEECPHCGQIVREQQVIQASDTGNLDELLGESFSTTGHWENGVWIVEKG